MRGINQYAKSLIYYDKVIGGEVDSYSPYPPARSAQHFLYGLVYMGLGSG